MSSNTGGWGESEVTFSLSGFAFTLGGLPGFRGGMGVLTGPKSFMGVSLRNPFLLKSTAVRLLTPGGGVEGADLSDWTLVGVLGLE